MSFQNGQEDESPNIITNDYAQIENETESDQEDEINSMGQTTGQQWPSVYDAPEWKNKLKEYPWLYCFSGQIGCSECKKCGSLSANKLNGKKFRLCFV
jgi:hypothetical protein